LTLKSEYREACPGCGSGLDELHSQYCDTARCAVTGNQLASCDAFNEIQTHECENTKWTGYWPGVQECFEYGLFAWFWPNVGYVPCGPDHPEAVCDLNALIMNYRWDATTQRRVQ
jgi:hypothetical protein